MLRSFRLSVVYLIILGLVPFFAWAQRTPFSVGTASAAPGEKATGYLEVPAGVDAGTKIPVVVVNGAKPGPVGEFAPKPNPFPPHPSQVAAMHLSFLSIYPQPAIHQVVR